MPLYNFDSLSKVLEVVYLEGTILKIDLTTETAKVKFELGSNSTQEKESIPFYYHCYDSAKLNSRGGLEDGYIPFKKNDKVIVACVLPDPTDMTSLQPLHIIAFSSGKKPCFFIYFVELRRQTNGWCFTKEKTYEDVYRLQKDSKREFYPYVVIKPVCLDPLEISESETSYYQVFGVFNSAQAPFERWKLYYVPHDVNVASLTNSEGFKLEKVQKFGSAVLSISHSRATSPDHSTEFLNFSFGEGNFGDIFGVYSQLGSCYVDRTPDYWNVSFGFGGWGLKNISTKVFFLSSSKMEDTSPTAQQRVIAGSRWSKKPMSIARSKIGHALYKYTAQAEGGNSIIYTDTFKDPCSYTQYFPFAALGKNASIYVKRTFENFGVVKDGQCVPTDTGPEEQFGALTIPAACRTGSGSVTLTVIAQKIFRYFYRQRPNLSDTLIVNSIEIAKSQSSGINSLSYERIFCNITIFTDCGIAKHTSCGWVFPGHAVQGMELTLSKVFDARTESASYIDEYISPLYYDGFLMDDKVYTILFYSKHTIETTEEMPLNQYLVSFSGYANSLFYDWVADASPYKIVTKKTSKHTYKFYLICILKDSIMVETQIGEISGTYETTTTSDSKGVRTTYKFTPQHGTIPSCVSCQVSAHGAVYTYLLYEGLYPENLDLGVKIYLKGQKRYIGVVSKNGKHTVYKESDAENILKNVVKSEYERPDGGKDTFEEDMSLNPKQNLAVGMFPCRRWEDK